MSKKILVIDDEADVRTYLKKLLERAGYVVETAEDGVQGIEAVRATMPDLVTLDLMMPKRSGTDFYRKLAADKDLCEMPVIVVSGLPGRHLAVKKPEAVFDKPIDPHEFLAAVRKVIGEAD